MLKFVAGENGLSEVENPDTFKACVCYFLSNFYFFHQMRAF